MKTKQTFKSRIPSIERLRTAPMAVKEPSSYFRKGASKLEKNTKIITIRGADSVVTLQIMKLPGVIIQRYRKPDGRCFEIAFKFILDNTDWTLVHGTIDIHFHGKRAPGYVHAWANRGDYIFEPINNCIFLRDEWEAFKPKEIKIYSAKKAAKEMLHPKHGPCSFGPWDPVFYARGGNTFLGFLK